MESAHSLHPEGKITAMKKTITLSISTPCSEKWGSFSSSTSRHYIGFLRAIAAGALLLFMSRQVSAQVKNTGKTEVVEPSKGQESKGLPDKATLMTVTGKVVDETGAPMPGINIILENASVGTITNEDGMFTFPQQLKAGQTLLFSFVGYVTKTFTVKEGTDPVEVALKMDEFDVLGELTVDQPYTIEAKRNLWSRIKTLF
jgi:hypothetical protein